MRIVANDCMKRKHKPIENCYWVIPGQFLAGEYPGDIDKESSRVKINDLIRSGITAFIDLTEKNEGLLPYSGLLETASHQRFPIKDTFFVNSLHQTESIYFHELVHVVQWERLGVDNFLLAYVAGLMQFGYQDSPLEQMAYSLQEDFENDRLPDGINDLIQQRADAVWADVASLIFGDFIANYNIQ